MPSSEAVTTGAAKGGRFEEETMSFLDMSEDEEDMAG
jgi:hypothetical protein